MALLEKHLYVKQSTIPKAGKGLFTKIAIPKNNRNQSMIKASGFGREEARGESYPAIGFTINDFKIGAVKLLKSSVFHVIHSNNCFC